MSLDCSVMSKRADRNTTTPADRLTITRVGQLRNGHVTCNEDSDSVLTSFSSDRRCVRHDISSLGTAFLHPFTSPSSSLSSSLPTSSPALAPLAAHDDRYDHGVRFPGV